MDTIITTILQKKKTKTPSNIPKSYTVNKVLKKFDPKA